MRHSLKLFFLNTLLLQYLYCLAYPLTENAQTFFTKFGWPTQAWDMLMEESLPADVYSDEQASRLVTFGMVYLDRLLTSHNQLINSLGNNHQLISASVVHGIDDASDLNLRPRWRWLPLIEMIDSDGQYVHQTSEWSHGTRLKSLDLLRLDSFNWKKVRLLVPTAIVRPIHVKGGFGRGLQFSTVYEFPSSFAHYLRQPTLATAGILHDTIRKNFDQWFSLVGVDRLTRLRNEQKLVTAKWIHESLQAYMRNARKSKGTEGDGTIAVEDLSDDHLPLDELEQPFKRFHGADHAPAYSETSQGADLSRATLPRAAIPLRSWNGQTLTSFRHNAVPAETVRSSTDMTSPLRYTNPEHFTLAPSGLSNTTPQLIRDGGNTLTHSYEPLHLDPMSSFRDNNWLQLGRSHAAGTAEDGSSSASISPAQGRSGTARWRRPPRATPEQATSP